jgi:hypothetical protein
MGDMGGVVTQHGHCSSREAVTPPRSLRERPSPSRGGWQSHLLNRASRATPAASAGAGQVAVLDP